MDAAQILFAGKAYDFPPLPDQVREIVNAGGIIAYLQQGS